MTIVSDEKDQVQNESALDQIQTSAGPNLLDKMDFHCFREAGSVRFVLTHKISQPESGKTNQADQTQTDLNDNVQAPRQEGMAEITSTINELVLPNYGSSARTGIIGVMSEQTAHQIWNELGRCLSPV